MIITLVTGEKVKVKESLEDMVRCMSQESKIASFTVKENKIIKGEYKEVEINEAFTIAHIVRYQP